MNRRLLSLILKIVQEQGTRSWRAIQGNAELLKEIHKQKNSRADMKAIQLRRRADAISSDAVRKFAQISRTWYQSVPTDRNIPVIIMRSADAKQTENADGQKRRPWLHA